jgi:flavodoxin I
MNTKIGLLWGSDTGMTEDIVKLIVDELGVDTVDSINVFDKPLDAFQQYDKLILGLSTWYDGELQSDWEEFFEDFQGIDFSGKQVVLFGLGDQDGYGQYFVDGLGIIGEVVVKNGGTILANWPIEGYDFEASKGLVTPTHFYGLAIDEDNQPELTDKRLEDWYKLLISEGFVKK